MDDDQEEEMDLVQLHDQIMQSSDDGAGGNQTPKMNFDHEKKKKHSKKRSKSDKK